jgi:hypothetical protein
MSDRNIARLLVGIGFLDRGRDLSGLDCWGVVWLAHKMCGNDLPLYSETSFNQLTDVSEIIAKEKGDWLSVEIGTEQALDVALLWSLVYLKGAKAWQKLTCHVGLVTGPAHILHCEEHIGTVHVAFRDAPGVRAHTTVSKRIVSIHRHKAFAATDLSMTLLEDAA